MLDYECRCCMQCLFFSYVGSAGGSTRAGALMLSSNPSFGKSDVQNHQSNPIWRKLGKSHKACYPHKRRLWEPSQSTAQRTLNRTNCSQKILRRKIIHLFCRLFFSLLTLLATGSIYGFPQSNQLVRVPPRPLSPPPRISIGEGASRLKAGTTAL